MLFKKISKMSLLALMLAIMLMFTFVLGSCGEQDVDVDDDEDVEDADEDNKDDDKDSEEVLEFDDDDEFMQHVESVSLKSVVDKLSSVYDKTLGSASQGNGISADMSIDVELSDDALEMIGSIAEMDVSWLSKVGLDYAVAMDESLIEAIIGLRLGGSKLIDIEAILDYGEGVMYMAVPEILTKYVGIGIGETMGVDFEMLEEAMAMTAPELPEADVMADMLTKYIDIVIDNIEAVESGEDTIEIGDIEQDCTILEFTITESDIQTIALAVLEEMAEDETLEEVIVAFGDWADDFSTMTEGYSSGDGDDAYDSFIEAVEDAIEYLEDAEADDEEVLMVLKDYVDERNNVLGRSIIVEDEEVLFFGSVTDGSDCAFAVIAGEEFEFSGEGTVKSDKFSGTANMIYYGDTYLEVEISDFDMEKLDEGYICGTFDLKFGDLLEEIGADTVVASLLSNYDLRLSLDSSNKGGEYEIGLVSGGDYFVKLTVKTEAGKSSPSGVPDDPIFLDENTDPEELLEYIDLDVLVDRLEDSPIPDEYVDALAEVANQLG